MKPAILAQKLLPVLPLMRCPRCGSALVPREQSLVCAAGHCYDLSRRGYVNLAPGHDQSTEKYGAGLFAHRREAFASGAYDAVLEAVAEQLALRFGAAPFTLLDVGCGEGFYARALAARFPAATIIGLDISRDAITAAARENGLPHWLVADLKHLPLLDGAADVVLDVLTPADYAEFRRVLKPGGLLVKALPGKHYLREVRNAVADCLRGGSAYDNARVLEHLSENASVLAQKELTNVYPLTAAQATAFLRMTPMTFSVPEETLAQLTLDAITIHMHVITATL